MSEPPRKMPVLRLDWWRFSVVAFLSLSVIGIVTVVGFEPDNRGTSVAMAVFGLSLVAFFAYRWHRLRTDAATGRLTPEEFYRDPRAHIRGPLLPLVVWLVLTIAALIAIVVFSATRGA
jgi:hypothetical protein